MHSEVRLDIPAGDSINDINFNLNIRLLVNGWESLYFHLLKIPTEEWRIDNMFIRCFEQLLFDQFLLVLLDFFVHVMGVSLKVMDRHDF